MKFYSEVTKELYDTVDALEAAEEKVISTERVLELCDNLADLQCEMIEIAKELAKFKGDKFIIPQIVVFEDGSFEVNDGEVSTYLDAKTGAVTKANVGKPAVVDMSDKPKVAKAEDVATRTLKNDPISFGVKLDHAPSLEELLAIFGEPKPSTGKAPVNPTVKAKNLTEKEVQLLLDVLNSL